MVGAELESRMFIHRERGDHTVGSILAGGHVVVGSLWDFSFGCDYFLNEIENMVPESEAGGGRRSRK